MNQSPAHGQLAVYSMVPSITQSRRTLSNWFRTTLCLSACICGAISLRAENIIQKENQRAGSTDWQLTRPQITSGTNRSHAIEGYCSQLSYCAGEELVVYVSTKPERPYNLDLYRLGYYAGTGARKVLSVQNLLGKQQPEPMTGPSELRYCRWSPAFRMPIPEEWVSGVYLGKLSVQDEGPQSYVIFTLRDSRQADLAFQVSDFTWQAYNRWPEWNSLYDYGENRWETKVSNRIGFDRPYARYHNGLPMEESQATKVIGSGEFLMWEFPLAYFLEKEGYDVTYISNLDTHQRPQLLTRVKAFLSVGHDEYWTRTMIQNVAMARDTGVDLLFLCGNSVYGEINTFAGPDGRPDRVISRNRSVPDEEQLMGASSYGVGLADWSVTDANHWLFQDTGMKTGDTVESLVGWEYHGPPLRKDPSLKVLARGKVHGMYDEAIDNDYTTLIYDGPRNNFVFNAATCWWSLPLSTPPGTVPAARGDFRQDDPRVQQMTRNLLDRAIGQD